MLMRRAVIAALVAALASPFAEAMPAPAGQQDAAQQQSAPTANPQSGNDQQNTQPGAPGLETRPQQPAAQNADQVPQNPGAKPVGTAAAPVTKPTGIAASRPAGAAIAPSKQRRVRRILIRVGIIVGAGVAVGTVAALSHGSSSRP
ncbi:MAG TPA: hypothetical protein VF786_00040 [Terriglobales bacterium]